MFAKVIIAVIVSASILLTIYPVVGYPNIVARNWNDRLSGKLLWLLNRVMGIDTSKYVINSVRFEGERNDTYYYIVELKGMNNSTIRVGVIVDKNDNILEIGLQNAISTNNILKTYKLSILREIDSHRKDVIIRLGGNYVNELINVISDIVEALSSNSSILKTLHGKIRIPWKEILLKRKEETIYGTKMVIGRIGIKITVHGDSGSILITLYYLYDISNYTTYKYEYSILDILLRPLPGNREVFTIHGIRYEPYRVEIYKGDVIRDPSIYNSYIFKYMKNYLAKNNAQECSIEKIRSFKVYGRSIGIVNNTRIIHIYYSYIVETNCSDYIIHFDPVNSTILSIEPYGTYHDINRETNDSNTIFNMPPLAVIVLIGGVIAAIILYIIYRYRR